MDYEIFLLRLVISRYDLVLIYIRTAAINRTTVLLKDEADPFSSLKWSSSLSS